MTEHIFLADKPISENNKVDSIFLVLVLLLWGLGLYTQFICTQEKAISLHFSSKYYFFYRQVIFSALGLVVFALVSLVPMKFIRKSVFFASLICLVLCFVTIFLGDKHKGATRWLSFGGFSFQPSEFAKFFLVLYLSHLFVKHSKEYELNNKECLFPLLVLFAFALTVFAQKDFSTGVFILIVGIAMFVICGANILYLTPFLVFVIPATVLLVASEDYRLNRVLAFFHPEDFESTYAYQVIKSQNAIKAGGFWGTGMGTGMNLVPSIPEVQTDYIFAGFANSMGLLGVTVYIFILILFAWRGFKISFNCPNKFASYASFGLVFTIVLQSLTNIAVVSGAAPTTGIPLPFFSAGGSSLISTFLMCGFVLNASHCKADDEDSEYKNEFNTYNAEEVFESFNGVRVEYE